jgi:hypothetical protein
VFNTNVYSGADGSLTVSEADGIDADVFGKYFGESGQVGRVTNVSINVTTQVKAFHEMGSHATRELRAGNQQISGSVERAYINGALLRLMLGKNATDEESTPIKMPTFSMKVILDNLQPEGDPGNSVLALYGVIFDSWQFSLPEDDFVLERLTFRARRISVADVEVG